MGSESWKMMWVPLVVFCFDQRPLVLFLHWVRAEFSNNIYSKLLFITPSVFTVNHKTIKYHYVGNKVYFSSFQQFIPHTPLLYNMFLNIWLFLVRWSKKRQMHKKIYVYSMFPNWKSDLKWLPAGLNCVNMTPSSVDSHNLDGSDNKNNKYSLGGCL